jgi:hypothetical protein
MCQSLRLVSLLIGQDSFEDLLIRLPDGFFSLMPETKEWVWDELLGAVNQGTLEPKDLAQMAEKLIAGETVSVPGAGQLSSGPLTLQDGVGLACSGDGSPDDEYSKEMAEKLIKEHGDDKVFEVHC